MHCGMWILSLSPLNTKALKRKKTKTYGLEGWYIQPRQGRSLSLPTLPYQRTNRYAVVGEMQTANRYASIKPLAWSSPLKVQLRCSSRRNASVILLQTHIQSRQTLCDNGRNASVVFPKTRVQSRQTPCSNGRNASVVLLQTHTQSRQTICGCGRNASDALLQTHIQSRQQLRGSGRNASVASLQTYINHANSYAVVDANRRFDTPYRLIVSLYWQTTICQLTTFRTHLITRVRDKTLSLCLLSRSTKLARLPFLYLSNLVQEGMISYPELANQPFRCSHFHRSENAFSKPWLCIIRLIAVLNVFWTAVPVELECCSSWIGTLFQLSWNRSST